jgi:hypothetical protein
MEQPGLERVAHIFSPVVRRTWISVIVTALLGAVIGLVYVLVYDPLCMCPAIIGPCGCTHDEIFGWQPGALAVPVWTAMGVVGGGIVGFAADRMTHR